MCRHIGAAISCRRRVFIELPEDGEAELRAVSSTKNLLGFLRSGVVVSEAHGRQTHNNQKQGGANGCKCFDGLGKSESICDKATRA